ncbi:MAG: murein biosynthesis integral membrane protein MurJ [Planctomycetia bacterium]
MSQAEPDRLVARHTGLVKRAAWISGLTLASRFVGYARETLAAGLFGDKSAALDAFVTAWRIPNLFRGLMGEGAIATAMQTELTRAEHERGVDRSNALFRGLFALVGAASLALVGLLVVCVVAMPDRMPWTDWPWLGADPAPVRELVARMLPFVVFACLAAVAGGALQVRGRFVAWAAAPALMNAVWIAALLWTASRHGWSTLVGAAELERQLAMARELAWLVLGAGSVLLLAQLPSVAGEGLLRRGEPIPWAEVRGVFARSAPIALGVAVFQVNIFVAGLYAEALLADGGPSIFWWVTRLQQLPLSLVSVAAASAVFPLLAAHASRGELGACAKLHKDTHHAILFLALPATASLVAIAPEIVSACFERGAFGPEGVQRGGAALRWLALAIVPVGAASWCARAHYALGETRQPLFAALASAGVNLVAAPLFITRLGMDVAGLCAASALAAGVQMVILGVSLRRLLPRTGEPRWRRLLLPTGLGILTALVARAVFIGASPGPTTVAQLLVAILCGSTTYVLGSLLLGSPELAGLRARLRQRRA